MIKINREQIEGAISHVVSRTTTELKDYSILVDPNTSTTLVLVQFEGNKISIVPIKVEFEKETIIEINESES